MKILWIVNTIFPAPSKELGLPIPAFGGWMYGLVEQLISSKDIQIAVATTYKGSELKYLNLDGIEYYLIPCKNNKVYDKKLELHWQHVCNQYKPDLVHIHGTEYVHALACLRKLPNLKYVITIQGLVSVIYKYYLSGLTFKDIISNITLRDIVRRDTLFNAKTKFKVSGEFEKEMIKRAKNVIGSTFFDKSHTIAIDPAVKYHFSNLTLRSGFYTAPKWSLDNCERNTIFLSQAGYPLKGLHQVIKAICLLKNQHPDILIKVAGPSIIKTTGIKDRLKLSGYGSYIKQLIKKNNLDNNVVFLGTLSEEQMIKEYLKANIFICPSSLENHCTSLGEAQLLGVPCISSYVGGMQSSMIHGETGFFYPFEEIEMLAQYIKEILGNKESAAYFSANGIRIAGYRHDKMENLKKTLEIYNYLVSK